MTVAVSTPPGTSPPDKYGGDPVAFDAAMQAHLRWQTSMISELNAQNAENNSLNTSASASATAAASSATSASTSASTATTKASEASASASAAASSASSASSSATSASSSATAAASSATSANSSAVAAAASAASIAAGPVSSVNGRVGAVTGVQDTLVSGTNIKTVNSSSIVGSGNLAVGDVTLSGTESLTNKTINKVTITTPATGSTLTIADGKTFTVLKTISLTSADDTGVYTLPTGTKTLVATDVTTLSSLVSVGTLTTGTWNATAIGVQYGGTGRATGTTAYGLIAAGTTATGAQQTLAAGATTEILVGGGASALPVWTAATGSGSPVRATGPILVTPTLDMATATSLQGIIGNVTPAAGTFTALTTTTSTTLASESVALTANNLPTVRPTLLLDFANSKSVDPRITFTRASTATRINDKGLIKTVASGAPRIDYDPVTLACKGLLIEESRTNLLTYSEQFDNAAWSKSNATITANATTAPDGTVTAEKLVEGTTASNNHVIRQSATNGNATYTFSVYIKAAERSIAFVGISDDVTALSGAYFDLTNQTVTIATGGSWTSVSSSMQSLTNGWYRCIVTGTRGAGTSTRCDVYTATSTSTVLYTGDGTSGIYIWGAQLEAGSFATSYIPTTSAQVTRAADVATVTGTNFSNWYRQDEGTFVASYSQIADITSGYPRAWAVGDGTNNNYIQNHINGGSNTNELEVRVNGTIQNAPAAFSSYLGASTTVAAAYKVLNTGLAKDGAAANQNLTTAQLPTVNILAIGTSATAAATTFLSGHIARIAYYPIRLANSTLQALSTL